MMNVVQQPRPASFMGKCGTKGRNYLRTTPHPTTDEFKKHSYWRDIAQDLCLAYGRICAYSCHFIPPDTGWRTVEHFKPKAIYPHLAYTWSNYRLVCGALNGRKRDFEDVLDPFIIQPGWFVLQFPETLILPGTGLSTRRRRQVEATIKRLQLNDDETCIDARQIWLKAYCERAANDEPGAFNSLLSMAPFMASELSRQALRGAAIIRQMSLVP